MFIILKNYKHLQSITNYSSYARDILHNILRPQKIIDYYFLGVETQWKLLTKRLRNRCRAYHE